MNTAHCKSGKLAFYFFLNLLFCLPIFAQDHPVNSSGDLLFWADRAAFVHTDSLVYHEIYLQIYCRDFAFEMRDDCQYASYRFSAVLHDSQGISPLYYDPNGVAIKTLQWKKNLQADLATDLNDLVAVETFAFQTTPGTYTLNLMLHDMASGKSAACSLAVSMPLPDTLLTISDIQFARRIDESSLPHRPLKNGLWILPNVTRTLSTKEQSLSFYYEIYGLSEGTVGSFDLAYTLRDSLNQPVKMYTSTRYKKPGATCVKTETLDIPTLTPGLYFLEITVRDGDTRRITSHGKSFSVSAPVQSILSTDPISLQRYYDQIQHLADKRELRTYNTLSPEEKVAFILKFWKDRDPTPDTPENEFAAEHFRRIKYADQTFPSHSKQRGSDTDKGRVYIRYGPPTDIERNAFSAIGKDFEIWTYEHLKYYQFIFLDRLGDSVQELVHSTMPGERYNPDWREGQVIGDPSDPMAPPPAAFGGAATDP